MCSASYEVKFATGCSYVDSLVVGTVIYKVGIQLNVRTKLPGSEVSAVCDRCKEYAANTYRQFWRMNEIIVSAVLDIEYEYRLA